MKKLYIFLSTILVAVGVALTYYFFEYAVSESTTYIWDTLLRTGSYRILVIPTCVILSLIFFGLQHYFDPRSERHESQGLGEAPAPTLVNFIKVMGIGFFSLVAGASLGPEAILVPASLLVGALVGKKLFKQDASAVNLLAMVGFVALFAAFFNSFLMGLLGLLIVKKEMKIQLGVLQVLLAVVASLVTVVVLGLLSSPAYVAVPAHTWNISLVGTVAVIGLFGAGYATTYALYGMHGLGRKTYNLVAKQSWWLRALMAAGGLSILYLLGGTLVQFTGDDSIAPMLQRSASLGLVGLAWIFLIKLLAIGWSKAFNYRGGLIFPSIFVASVLVAIAQLYTQDIGFMVGLIAVLAGLFVANIKVKILF